jgi:hypothetical protein
MTWPRRMTLRRAPRKTRRNGLKLLKNLQASYLRAS